jgi:hypothetical protein
VGEGSRPLSFVSPKGEHCATFNLIALQYAKLYYEQAWLHMDLSSYSIEQLEQLLKDLPEEISRRETDDGEAALRKRRVFLGFQELAAKQGVDLDKL